MCDLRRVAQIIGAIPRETAGSFQEVPLNSRITPWVFNKRSNLTFICVRSLHLLHPRGMCGIWRIAQLLGGSSELKNYSMGVFLVLLASTAPEGVPLGYSELGVPRGDTPPCCVLKHGQSAFTQFKHVTRLCWL